MESNETRLSKVEAVQHFTLGLLAGVIDVLRKSKPELMPLIEHHLERHHAILVGESVDPAKVAAFQELQGLLFPASGSGPQERA